MSEPSKFSGALARLKAPTPEESLSPQSESPQTEAVKPEAVRKDSQKSKALKVESPTLAEPRPAGVRGRRPGKRSDPDYEPTTVLLRKKTKKLANRKLEDGESGQDLSDLIEQLLASWIQT